MAMVSDKKGEFNAMVVCFILGLGSLIAWSSILMIEDYYYKMFPRYHPSRVLTIAYQACALGTMIAMAYYESKIKTRIRIIAGYSLLFIGILLLLVLDLATSGKGGVGPYIGVCALCATFGIADALVQSGMIGDTSVMSPKFIQSFLAGLAASGTTASGLRFLTMVVFEKSENGLRKGAMLFLAMSLSVALACLLVYVFYFPRLSIIKHYLSKAFLEGMDASADQTTGSTQNEVGFDANQQELLSIKQLFFRNIDYAADVFLLYALTLSIFPGFLFENTSPHHHLGKWYPLVLVSTHYFSDFTSRYIPLVKFLKLESRNGLFIAVVARFLLIPAFYFCAKYGEQGWMIMLVVFLGLTNGYLTVCVLTMAPKGYKGIEQSKLGHLLVLFLLCGIFVGVTLDWLWLLGK